MGDTNTIAIVLLVFFLFVSASFTLIKAVFAAIYAKREDHDRTDREAKIAKIVENRGYNETVSIGRIFSDVGIGVFGFYLFSNAPWQWTHDWQAESGDALWAFETLSPRRNPVCGGPPLYGL